MPKPKPDEKKSAKAVAKTAQRVKMIERPVPCPQCGKHMRPVNYYPPKGRPVDARGCASCRVVFRPTGWAVLALEVAGL